MKQIRKHIFETNSSSVHSVVLTGDHSKITIDESNIPVSDDGFIHIDPEYFGKSGVADTQYEKLQYLVVRHIATHRYDYDGVLDSDMDTLYHAELSGFPGYDEYFADIVKHAGADGIIFDGDAYDWDDCGVDHQSADPLDEFFNDPWPWDWDNDEEEETVRRHPDTITPMEFVFGNCYLWMTTD